MFSNRIRDFKSRIMGCYLQNCSLNMISVVTQNEKSKTILNLDLEYMNYKGDEFLDFWDFCRKIVVFFSSDLMRFY